MNNLLSYCGLVDARISASEKDLPVLKNLLSSFYKHNSCTISGSFLRLLNNAYAELSGNVEKEVLFSDIHVKLNHLTELIFVQTIDHKICEELITCFNEF